MLGEMHAASFKTDPKHLGFVLARYHFVARMFEGKENVLEVGCGDGTGASIVKEVVGKLIGMDKESQRNYPGHFWLGDILDGAPPTFMDAIFALDVLEHILPVDEDKALYNITRALLPSGVCIIGTPSRESQPYASELSRKYHVNCKTENELRSLMGRHFENVFMFGMNDATLHTGFGPMCHYRLALCTGKRE